MYDLSEDNLIGMLILTCGAHGFRRYQRTRILKSGSKTWSFIGYGTLSRETIVDHVSLFFSWDRGKGMINIFRYPEVRNWSPDCRIDVLNFVDNTPHAYFCFEAGTRISRITECVNTLFEPYRLDLFSDYSHIITENV